MLSPRAANPLDDRSRTHHAAASRAEMSPRKPLTKPLPPRRTSAPATP